MNRILGLLLFLGLGIATSLPLSALSNGLSNVVVARVGDSTVLRCPGLLKNGGNTTCHEWAYKPPGSHGTSFGDRDVNYCNDGGVTVDDEYRERFHVETDYIANGSTLSIKNITSNDSGRYECKEKDSDDPMFQNELIVIDDRPNCSAVAHIEFDTKTGNYGTSQTWKKLHLYCKVAFAGSLNADQRILEWRVAGTGEVLSSKYTINEDRAISKLTLNATSHVNGTSYSCVVAGSVNTEDSCETGAIKVVDPHLHLKKPTKQQDTKSPKPFPDHTQRPPLKQDEEQPQQQLLLLKQLSGLVRVQEKLLAVEKKRLQLEKAARRLR